jgi:thiaminase
MPVVGLDACFLKGMYKEQFMSALGRDANNNMYPIAMAVVEAETKDSWTWFLEARSWPYSTWVNFYFGSTLGKLVVVICLILDKLSVYCNATNFQLLCRASFQA